TAIGEAVLRKEDAKLLTGQGRYVDNLTAPGMVWAYLVRSPYAHAKIVSVGVTAAREAEGVVAAFSGQTSLPTCRAPSRAAGRRRGRRLLAGGCDRQGALPPAAARPERDGAARRAGAARSGDRGADPDLLDAGAAHPPHDALADARHPGGEAARDRAGRRRRLRLEGRRLRRGGALPRARP